MKSLLSLLLLGLWLALPAWSYNIQYAEQWYNLVHRHLSASPDDSLENIWYLERALRSDFANPLNALAKIENPQDWEHYRNLFRMHVNLLLVQQSLILGGKFDKQQAYFYNYPWKAANLDSLDQAEKIYQFARGYWQEAQNWAQKANQNRTLVFEELQFWSDEAWRIENGELDYGATIQKQLDRLQKVRSQFKAMGPQTY